MRKEKLMYIILTLFFLTVNVLEAQQSVLSSGQNLSGSGGFVSYSVGQIAYQTINGSNASEAQGVQQPYEISVVLGTGSINLPDKNIIVFPNPVSNNVILKLTDFESNNIVFKLYDSSGKLLDTNKIIENETNIMMDNFPSTIYLLEILKNNVKLKTFKIIKKN